MLSQAAFNAFLKTLEEPPAHAIFILATTEKHKILPTILSRCQTYDFNRITVENIVRNLRMVASNEGVSIDDESLHVIAHKADGAMRDALTIFDQTIAFCGTEVKYQDVLRNLNVLDYEYSFSLVDAFLAGDYPSALLKFDEILTKGFNALHFVAALSSHMRDLIVTKSGGLDALLELPQSLKVRYKEQADRCSLQFLYEALGITTQCESGYRASVNPRLHIEFALMRLSFLSGKLSAPAAPATPAQPLPAAAPAVAVPQQVAPTAAVQPVAPASSTAAPETATSAVPVAPVHTSSSVPAASQPAQNVASTPVAPAASSGAAVPVVEQTAPTEQQPRERRSRASRTGISLKSIVEAPQTAEIQQVTEDVAPSDEDLKAKWPELAKLYSDKPRLASMLSTTTLDIVEENGFKTVTFRVVNDAQKEWVESKLLHELEGRYRKVAGSLKIYLRVMVIPDDTPDQKKIYMPSDQAKELMAHNSEVENLVKDLHLDIK